MQPYDLTGDDLPIAPYFAPLNSDLDQAAFDKMAVLAQKFGLTEETGARLRQELRNVHDPPTSGGPSTRLT